MKNREKALEMLVAKSSFKGGIFQILDESVPPSEKVPRLQTVFTSSYATVSREDLITSIGAVIVADPLQAIGFVDLLPIVDTIAGRAVNSLSLFGVLRGLQILEGAPEELENTVGTFLFRLITSDRRENGNIVDANIDQDVTHYVKNKSMVRRNALNELFGKINTWMMVPSGFGGSQRGVEIGRRCSGEAFTTFGRELFYQLAHKGLSYSTPVEVARAFKSLFLKTV